MAAAIFDLPWEKWDCVGHSDERVIMPLLTSNISSGYFYNTNPIANLVLLQEFLRKQITRRDSVRQI